MKIINHRCNTKEEILRAVEGIEIDVRTAFLHRYGPVAHRKALVLSHDPCWGGIGSKELEFVQLCDLLREHKKPSFVVAINVKESGLAPFLATMLQGFPCEYYLFDVPGADIPEYLGLKLRVFGRYSEFEKQIWQGVAGIEIDSFYEGEARLIEQARSSIANIEGGVPMSVISRTVHRNDPSAGDRPEVLDSATYLITKRRLEYAEVP